MSAIGVRLHAGSLRSTSMDALCISGGAHVEAVAALFRQAELLCLSFWRSAGECSDRVAMADSARGLKRDKVDISGHREARSVVFYEGLRLCGGAVTNHAVRASGSAKEGPHVRGGS